MTDMKRLLDEATPLPWAVQVPGDNDPGAGTVFIDTHAYPDGPEPVITNGYPLGEADARLIVHAVNRLPDYEAAVDALEALVASDDAMKARSGLRYVHAGQEVTHISETALDDARAVLRRLRLDAYVEPVT